MRQVFFSCPPGHKNAITNRRINKAFFLLILKKEEEEEEREKGKKEKEKIMFSLLFINWLKVWPDMMIPLNTAPDLPTDSCNTVREDMGQKSLGSYPWLNHSMAE